MYRARCSHTRSNRSRPLILWYVSRVPASMLVVTDISFCRSPSSMVSEKRTAFEKIRWCNPLSSRRRATSSKSLRIVGSPPPHPIRASS